MHYSEGDKLVDLLHAIIDERVENITEKLELRVSLMVQEALASYEHGFDISDYEGEIKDMIEETVTDLTFTVTVES
tara:strand:- start:450 stop:677 length:228 start_codon:yes stop_codon:yes gene_type:complete